MLKPIEQFFEDTLKVPSGVPRALKEYLQVRYSATVLFATLVKDLKSAGYSEAYIAGVLHGLHYASGILDEIDNLHKEEI